MTRERPQMVQGAGRIFPQELLDEVFDQCDEEALWQLRGVNKSFCEQTRVSSRMPLIVHCTDAVTSRILFRFVSIQSPIDRSSHFGSDYNKLEIEALPNRLLLNKINAFPRLAHYVEHVDFDCGYGTQYAILCQRACRPGVSPEARRFLMDQAWGDLPLYANTKRLQLCLFDNDAYPTEFLATFVAHGIALEVWENLEELDVGHYDGEDAAHGLIAEVLKKGRNLRKLDLGTLDERFIGNHLKDDSLLPLLRNLVIRIENPEHGLFHIFASPNSWLGMFKALASFSLKVGEDQHFSLAQQQQAMESYLLSPTITKLPVLQHLRLEIRTDDFRGFWSCIAIAAPLLEVLQIDLLWSWPGEEPRSWSTESAALKVPYKLERLHTVELSCTPDSIPHLLSETMEILPKLSNLNLKLVHRIAQEFGRPSPTDLSDPDLSTLCSFITHTQYVVPLQNLRLQLTGRLGAALTKRILAAVASPIHLHLHFTERFDGLRSTSEACLGCVAFPRALQGCHAFIEECDAVINVLQRSRIRCTIQLQPAGMSSAAQCDWCRELEGYGVRSDQVVRMNEAQVGMF